MKKEISNYFSGDDLNNSKYLFEHLDEFFDLKEDNRTAIITDIDGTISRIVPTPMEAVVDQDMKDTIRKLAEKFEFTGVMTGRSIENALEMVGDENLIYIGNHGLEQLKNGRICADPEVKKFLPVIKKVGKSIKKKLSNYGCILFQDKELSFTVHYRLCDDGGEIRQTVLDAIAEINDSKHLKISEGRKVIEIRPPLGHNKGTILQNLIFENDIKKIIYLGDDITDADAFIQLNELNKQKKVKAISIVVISKETPQYVKRSASYYVNSIDEVQKFFKWISNG